MRKHVVRELLLLIASAAVERIFSSMAVLLGPLPEILKLVIWLTILLAVLIMLAQMAD